MATIYTIESNFLSFTQKTGLKGDFARILWIGHVSTLEYPMIEIERYGSDIPSAYEEMGNFIVIQKIKDLIEKSDLVGAEYLPCIKKKIIKGDWLNFDESFFYDYNSLFDVIENGQHNEKVATQMPNIWCINPIEPLIFTKENNQFSYIVNKYSDFYYGTGDKQGFFISEKAKLFLESLDLPLDYFPITTIT